jgi:hypothetical protein
MGCDLSDISLLNLKRYPRNRGMLLSLQGFLHTLGSVSSRKL